MKHIVCILGQTATGKTEKAHSLAKICEGELVNCDSRQIYTHLDIITGKTDNPTDVPIHMVDVVDAKERYSAHTFAQRAYQDVQDIVSRGITPIVVGGSGLYARSLLLYNPSRKPNTSLEEIFFEYNGEHIFLKDLDGKDVYTLQELYSHLDPDWTETLNPSDRQNPRRLVRAIQKRVTGDANGFMEPESAESLVRTYAVDVTVLFHKDEKSIAERITKRVLYRIELGAIDECEGLLARGYFGTDPGLQTLGYRSIFRYLGGSISYDEMVGEWVTKEKQYAKRQKLYLQKYFPEAKTVYV